MAIDNTVVKTLDLKSNAHRPRRFKSWLQRMFFDKKKFIAKKIDDKCAADFSKNLQKMSLWICKKNVSIFNIYNAHVAQVRFVPVPVVAEWLRRWTWNEFSKNIQKSRCASVKNHEYF